MATLLVTYDLNKPGKDYGDVLKIVKDQAAWARLSESSYAIKTNLSPHALYKKFEPYIDNNDQIYIITLSKPFWGLGTKEVNDWLENNL